MIGIYSAFLGFSFFAGGKWLIEAPYMLEASKALRVHIGWVVQTYNASEALANLIHPSGCCLSWAYSSETPDTVGYSMLQFGARAARASSVWALNYTPACRFPPALP